MIEQCKVTMECKLIDHVKLPTHDLFVGEIVGHTPTGRAHQRHRRHRQAEAAAFDMASKKYWSLGEPVAKCWEWARTTRRQLTLGAQGIATAFMKGDFLPLVST